MRRRFDKQGLLALYPQALFELHVEVPDRANETVGDVEIVRVRGPLVSHAGWWADSYEEISDRVRAACAGSARTVLLRIDSPGGDVFGMADCARAMRAACAKAGKRLVAYVDGCACSAGYALACAAEKIYANESSYLGSIGILETRLDVSEADAAQGVRVAMIASGKRKTDGYAHVPFTAEERAATQLRVNSLASLFFELVASMRGIGVDDVAALDAGVFHGEAAVSARLADRVASFDEVLAALANGGDMADENNEERRDGEEQETPTPSSSQQDVEDAREALRRAANDGNEAAARALEVLEAGADEEGDDEEGAEGARAAASAPPAARPAAQRGAPRVSASTAADLAAEFARVSERLARLENEREDSERSALIASRPDIGAPLATFLATKPLAEVKEILKRMKKPAAANPAAGATTVPATRGASQTSPQETGPRATAHSPEASSLDRAMGLATETGGVRRTGHSLEFRAPRNMPPRAALSTATPTPAVTPARGDAQ